jgi:hypothetical protein
MTILKMTARKIIKIAINPRKPCFAQHSNYSSAIKIIATNNSMIRYVYERIEGELAG